MLQGKREPETGAIQCCKARESLKQEQCSVARLTESSEMERSRLLHYQPHSLFSCPPYPCTFVCVATASPGAQACRNHTCPASSGT